MRKVHSVGEKNKRLGAEPWKNQYLWAWRETERGRQDAEKKEAGEEGKGEKGRLMEADRVEGQTSETGERSVDSLGRPLSAAFGNGVSWAVETSQRQVSRVPKGCLMGRKWSECKP